MAPCNRQPPCQGAASLAASVVALASSRLLLVAAPAGLAAVGRPTKGVAVVGLPCNGPGHGRSPHFLATFAAKMQRECVERFYTIHSYHT
ncbi:hypothetical protein B296_00045003 [Ensete ventricosum]|uniref:Secreted protein n=1 Tax=Ensete ventricosum TaxID=4639 RepID=A0A426XTV8_ENSVE|nr:hypothetical protein B296_00045003 [Ensete ventricosum]